MGGDDGLGAGLGEVMEQGDQAEAGGEGQRGVGFVHEVEARLIHPGAQYLQEALSMTELMEPLRVPAGVVFQVAVERVHGVRAQEIGPAGADGSALYDQVRAQSWLAVPGPEELRHG